MAADTGDGASFTWVPLCTQHRLQTCSMVAEQMMLTYRDVYGNRRK